MKNTINCLSLSPQLMKKWRISRRSTFEEKHLTSNGVHTDDRNHHSRQEYLRFLGKLARWLTSEVDISSSANLAVGDHWIIFTDVHLSGVTNVTVANEDKVSLATH